MSVITQHVQDNQRIRPRQTGFVKGKSYLTDLMLEVNPLVDEGKTVVILYLDFSKAFNMISHSILLENLIVHGLDRCTFYWMGWIDGLKPIA